MVAMVNIAEPAPDPIVAAGRGMAVQVRTRIER